MNDLTSAKVKNILIEGNRRFAFSKIKSKNPVAERIRLRERQESYAIIVTCSDSRVVPEIIFDSFLAELFIIRIGGKVIDDAVL